MYDLEPATFARQNALRRLELEQRLSGRQTPVRHRPAAPRWPLKRFLWLHSARRPRIPLDGDVRLTEW